MEKIVWWSIIYEKKVIFMHILENVQHYYFNIS